MSRNAYLSLALWFHHQLSMSSIKFQHDEEGIEFLTINHETHQKNYQGGLEDATEEAQDKRMYAWCTRSHTYLDYHVMHPDYIG
jgi:hypothetical protein